MDVFSKLSEKSINYLGVFQPRNNDQNEIYTEFYRAIYSGKKINKIQKRLESELQKGKNLLISEEMIVVSTLNNNWRDNIKNLSKIIMPYDYKIIITVREPVKAMFSYYVERYKTYKKLKKSFEKIALEDESMEIYHYKLLFEHLLKYFDKEKIMVKKFEELINNQYDDLLQILKVNNFQSRLNNHNIKNKNKNSVKVEYALTPINNGIILFFSKTGFTWLIEKLKIKSLLLKILYFINKFGIKRKDEVIIPKEMEFNKIRLSLNEETIYLLKEFKIDYCHTNLQDNN